jgi:hypothetical protein
MGQLQMYILKLVALAVLMPVSIDVRMKGGRHVIRAHGPEGITIFSDKPLDDSVRDSIRSVRISAGNNDEVTFIDGSEASQRVMMRKVEVAQQHSQKRLAT